jgi:hypothetical protein
MYEKVLSKPKVTYSFSFFNLYISSKSSTILHLGTFHTVMYYIIRIIYYIYINTSIVIAERSRFEIFTYNVDKRSMIPCDIETQTSG